jgi:Chlorophyll A-B binding protein
VKHARLAMLAALGWVVAELFDGRLAAAAGAPDLLVRLIHQVYCVREYIYMYMLYTLCYMLLVGVVADGGAV